MSPQAISLAQRNLAHLGLGNISGAGSSVDLRLADVLVTSTHAGTSEGVSGWQTVLEQHDLKYRQSWRTSTNISGPKDKGKTALSLQWDVLMSNPPYVSPRQYQKVTSRSVRHYEPQIALVPPSSHGQVETDDARADVFYHALIDMAIETGVRYILFEVGDAAQAARVVKVMQEKLGEAWKSMRVEVWRDEPGVPAGDGPMAIDEELLNGVAVTGRGNVRGVFAFEIV
ncbi:Hypothetical protein D9617_1g085840 [Elsinoe fawcettii]|nr:Hypothetical protein D9617_1g085840 [Elsinoe fawcettii]